MTQQTWRDAGRPPGQERSRLASALWAAVIAFTVVVSSGGVLFAYQRLDGGSRPAPAPAAAPAGDRISPLGAGTASTAPSATPLAAAGTSRLELIGPRTVLDTRTGDGPLPAGAAMDVPLTGVPEGSTAVLVEVSLLKADGVGAVALISGDEKTPVLRAPRAGAQTSATVVAPLDGEDLRVRTEGGGHLVVTLTGAFEPATTSAAGRFLAVEPAEALVLRPGQDGNRATIRAADLPLGGVPRDSVGALLLTFRADVGTHGGTVAIGPSRDEMDQQVFWGATSGSDRTRGGFLVVPAAKSLKLYYHAGTKLVVTVVGVVTGDDAPNGSAGLSVPIRSEALPELTVPSGGRADVTIPEAGTAKAALVTTAVTPKGGKPRAALGLFDVTAGSLRVNAPERAQVILTPRLLIQ